MKRNITLVIITVVITSTITHGITHHFTDKTTQQETQKQRIARMQAQPYDYFDAVTEYFVEFCGQYPEMVQDAVEYARDKDTSIEIIAADMDNCGYFEKDYTDCVHFVGDNIDLLSEMGEGYHIPTDVQEMDGAIRRYIVEDVITENYDLVEDCMK